MGALANAVNLMGNAEWKQWLMASAAYNARLIVTEPADTPDHAVRLRMATDVLSSPDMLTQRLVVVVSTDPAVASSAVGGAGTAGTPAGVGEALGISKVADVWTSLAKLIYGSV